MKVTKWDDIVSKYVVDRAAGKLTELGYEYNTSTACWKKKVKYTEVFDKTDDFEDSNVNIEIKVNGELNIRYNWELYSATGGTNYGGFIEVSILDEIMKLNETGLIRRRGDKDV